MDFTAEINEAIDLGLEHFKLFLQNKLKENKDYLESFFWVASNNTPMTVLNYVN
jgi:hypothetical protein